MVGFGDMESRGVGVEEDRLLEEDWLLFELVFC